MPRNTAAILLAASGVCAFAQPAFEVASIKPIAVSATVGVPAVRVSPGGKLEANTSLRSLIMYAYDIKAYQLSDGPPWMTSQFYRIVANPAGGGDPSAAEIKTMLQALLADRFQLKIRRENKEMNVYLLKPGKNGSKLKESAADARFSTSTTQGSLTGTKVTMDNLARMLSISVDRPVLDRTGLTAGYDVKLQAVEVGFMPNRSLSPTADDTGAASIFSAIQDQLGLRLEAAKEPLEFLTIERVEKPSEN